MEEGILIKEILRKSFLNMQLKEKLKMLEIRAKLDGYIYSQPFIEYLFSVFKYGMKDFMYNYHLYLILLNILVLLYDMQLFKVIPLFSIIVS